MKVFVQHRKTKLFIAAGSLWVADISKALDFKRIMPAMDCCSAEKIHNTFLVLYFQSGGEPTRIRPFGEKKAPRELIAPAVEKRSRRGSEPVAVNQPGGQGGGAKMLRIFDNSKKAKIPKIEPQISPRPFSAPDAQQDKDPGSSRCQ